MNEILTNIKLSPQAIEIVLTALNQLPRGQVEVLFQNIVTQYQDEIKRLQAEAVAAELAPEPEAD
jgi:hypothetical protein